MRAFCLGAPVWHGIQDLRGRAERAEESSAVGVYRPFVSLVQRMMLSEPIPVRSLSAG